MSTFPYLPEHYIAYSGVSTGHVMLTRNFSSTHSVTMYLGRDEARALAGLLQAENAAEIGDWLEAKARQMDSLNAGPGGAVTPQSP